MDITLIEGAWKRRGFSCGVWIDPPKQEWKNYTHDTDELFMVVEGEMELEMRGEVIKAQLGQEILIPANTPHTVRTTGKTFSRWLYGYKTP